MFVDAFSHRKVISQSPSKISQACGATKERKEFKGGARDLGSTILPIFAPSRYLLKIHRLRYCTS